MKREIKFRGKYSHNGEWVFGSLLKIENNYHIVDKTVMYEDGHHIRQEIDIPTWVEPDTIGQFTGLYDRNGNEIYDKDIVGYGDKGVFMVCYNKDCCQFEFRTTLCDGGFVDGLRSFNSNIYVVLGNVFDNPELMK